MRRSIGTSLSLAFVVVVGLSATLSAQDAALTRPQSVDRVFSRWTAATPGCTVGVSDGGKVVYTQGYGLANLEYGVRIKPDTIFESGSVAKQFTAGAIELLVQDGKLSLDDPVRKYVPEVPDFGTPILIRHLLTHTSGLRSQWPLMGMMGRPTGRAVHTVPEILELVAFQKALNFKPGDEFLYNNTGFTLLSVVVARVSGMSFNEFCRERLFKPLGMDRTQWRTDFRAIVPGRATAYLMEPDGSFRTYMSFTNVVGNGGLLTTVDDLLKWNANLDNPRVGGAEWAKRLQTPARLNDGTEVGYAHGLYVQTFRGVREISHGGTTAGYLTYLARFPDQRLSVAVLCNTTGSNPSDAAHAVAAIYLGSALRPETRAKAVDVPADTLARVAGLYRERLTDALMRLSWDAKAREIRGGGVTWTPTGLGVLSDAGATRTLTFDAGDGATAWPSGGAVRIIERAEGAQPRTWHLEAPWAPGPDQLGEFIGDYVSDELSISYSVMLAKTGLVVRFRPAQGYALTPAFKDAFEGDGNTLRFTRDASGTIDGFEVYGGRVRHVRFTRR
jgi:CubicO group peptidase (beta-lactamase class C family)